MEIKHVVFNPQNALMFDGGPLNSILEREEVDGWMLERVVPYTQYQCVAVLVRDEVSE